ncbi:E3 ubiquitin-protein ligase RHF1A-like [Salvia miltiorrhiza]|uniref:E3 ubiquitin-protein ligase RHF1A-like n=1 Tax=Salvia miltiorrhiza TaxID=226208 RepID=UPI0025ABE87F|nr:E3 ubiquitin-protein ligase RHF1A-like [Salvia miltiorrhiza]
MSDEMNASPSSMVVGDFIVDEDGCSICLDPFTSLHPATVTKCKHEYHLHCILEWSRRRSQCPVCLQHLVLKDPASQEMAAAATRENESKTKRSNQETEHPPRARGRLMRRRAAAVPPGARRIMVVRRRRPSTNPPPLHYFPATDSSPSAAPAVTPADTRSRSRSSESLKSRLSTASIRYREWFSKGTRSLKEKIMARNDSMKELSSTGIAGIAKLISRVSSTGSTAGASHSRRKAGGH